MKTRMISLVCIFLFTVVLTVGCAPKEFHPEGTWVNEQQVPQKEIDTADGVWTQYKQTSDTSVYCSGTLEVISQWTDPEGNVWRKVLSTLTLPEVYKGNKVAVLQKYSMNGTVKESVWVDADLNNLVFPIEIDASKPHYEVYNRLKE